MSYLLVIYRMVDVWFLFQPVSIQRMAHLYLDSSNKMDSKQLIFVNGYRFIF